MTIVFSGLQCDMVLVVASISYEGLLGTGVCSHACLISLISVQVNCLQIVRS